MFSTSISTVAEAPLPDVDTFTDIVQIDALLG
jgi:hypothetical protein